MTQEEITIAKAILSKENLASLGFESIGKTHDVYGGDDYQYKGFKNIRIINFMGIRNLELYFSPCQIINRESLIAEGLDDAYKQYKIYDIVNEHPKIDIHSNEELIAICEKWAQAIKNAAIKEAKHIEEYYKSL